MHRPACNADNLHERFAMPMLSVSKAAKIFDVSRPTLQKALKDGVISGHKIKSGGSESWQIDTTELARVYLLRPAFHANNISHSMECGQAVSVEKNNDPLHLTVKPDKVVEGLAAELAKARADLEQARADQLEIQKELAASQAVAEERKRLLDDVMRLLPPPVPAEPAKDQQRKSWWPWSRS